MEIAIRKNSMKTVSVSIARLVQNIDIFQRIALFYHGVEDVGDLSFRFVGAPNYGSIKLLGAWHVDEFSVFHLCFKSRAAEEMAAGCLACSGVSKHCYRWLYDFEESHIASLDSFEERLGFGFDGGWFGGLKSHHVILNIL